MSVTQRKAVAARYEQTRDAIERTTCQVVLVVGPLDPSLYL